MVAVLDTEDMMPNENARQAASLTEGPANLEWIDLARSLPRRLDEATAASPVNVSRVLTLRIAPEGLGWGRSRIEVSLPVANRRYCRLPLGPTPLAVTADTNVRNIRASAQASAEA